MAPIQIHPTELYAKKERHSIYLCPPVSEMVLQCLLKDQILTIMHLNDNALNLLYISVGK